jgi:hypothetical protein
VAILLATELAGILGALLAIPVAGIIKVVLADLWEHRRGAPTPPEEQPDRSEHDPDREDDPDRDDGEPGGEHHPARRGAVDGDVG